MSEPPTWLCPARQAAPFSRTASNTGHVDIAVIQRAIDLPAQRELISAGSHADNAHFDSRLHGRTHLLICPAQSCPRSWRACNCGKQHLPVPRNDQGSPTTSIIAPGLLKLHVRDYRCGSPDAGQQTEIIQWHRVFALCVLDDLRMLSGCPPPSHPP
jgi:hypothetical protein